MSDLNNSRLQKLRDFFDNPEEVAKMREHFRKIDMVLDHQSNRFKKYISSIPEEKLSEEFEKFLKWEYNFEEDQYTRNHCLTSSNIFSCVISYARERGKQSKRLNEMFLSEKFTFSDYTFKLYCGQGYFWRIMKKNKQIFQTT